MHGARPPPATRNPDAPPYEGLGPSAGARCRLSPPPRETGPLSHSHRGVRAPGATETPEPTSHVGTEAREPAPCLWAQPGEGPSPQGKGRDRNRPPPQGVSALNHTKSRAPAHLHGARSPSLQTLLLFSGCVRGFTSAAPCPAPGAGPCLWPGSTPPDARLCTRLLPLLRGGALPRPSSRARRGLTRPPCVGGRGAPGVQRPRKDGSGDHRAERAWGPSAKGATHRAKTVAEQTCLLRGGETLRRARALGLGPLCG